jgi:hypothetical protein
MGLLASGGLDVPIENVFRRGQILIGSWKGRRHGHQHS